MCLDPWPLSGLMSQLLCENPFFHILHPILTELQFFKPFFTSHPCTCSSLCLRFPFLVSFAAFTPHPPSGLSSDVPSSLPGTSPDPSGRSDTPLASRPQPWPLWVITVWGPVCPLLQTVSPGRAESGQSQSLLGPSTAQHRPIIHSELREYQLSGRLLVP